MTSAGGPGQATESAFDVGSVEEFPEGSISARTVADTDIIVVCQGGEFFAMPDRCTHQRYPLNDGELLEGKIRCIHHGATFDLRSGRATLPAIKKIQLFSAAVQDGRVVVSLQER